MNSVTIKITGLLIVFLISLASQSFAEKTDVIILKNGGHIIGEIRKMDQGKLTYSTDEMKVVYVDWMEIARISSISTFDIEMASGLRHHGSLVQAAEDGKVVIVTETERITADLLSVVNIAPLDTRFLELFKGSLSFGFNFQKANSLATLTASSDITCHTKKWEARLETSNYFSSQTDAENNISRNSATATFNKFLPARWAVVGMGQVQQNDQLSLDLRATLGLSGGRYVVKNNRMILLGLAGLMLTNEKFTGEDTNKNNAEAFFALDFQTFRYHSPEMQLSSNIQIYPSITDFGRVRIEFNTSFYYELIKNFYFTLSVFDHFDSHPPTTDISKNDYGVDVSISWKFY